MVLEYLPTFTLKTTQFCRFLYTSSMGPHLGLGTIGVKNQQQTPSQIWPRLAWALASSFFDVIADVMLELSDLPRLPSGYLT